MASEADEDAHADAPRSSYVPQFTASSSLILKRLADSTNTPDPSLKRASMTPQPSSSLSSEAADSGSSQQDHGGSLSSTIKRKHEQDDMPDFTMNTMPFPVQKKAALGPGVSKATSPAADNDAGVAPPLQSAKHQTSSSAVHPAKKVLVGFHAGNASDAARAEYFTQKSRIDLLNILSFCDQLRPQLLPDILVSVSKKHPSLPIFDSPDWEKSLGRSDTSQAPAPVPRRAPGRPRHGHTAINPHARQRTKSLKKAPTFVAAAQAGTSSSGPVIEVAPLPRNVMPPTWPKAGEGLYAKLPPEKDDNAILMDDDDHVSFSQFMVDPLGKPVRISACA